MKLSDLITDAQGQRLSHSKIWANVACATATVVFIKQGWAGTLTADIWFAYLGSLGGYSVARRWLANKGSTR